MIKDDFVFVEHILNSIETIENYCINVSKEEFMKDMKLQDAVIRRIEIIGEAIKNLSTEFMNKHSDILWNELARMRDKLIHHYFGVDLNLTYEVIKTDLPKLKEQLTTIKKEETL